MTQFIAFGLYLCFSCFLLISVPVMLHPTLPRRRKILINLLSFTVLVPVALLIYALVGVPKMAG